MWRSVLRHFDVTDEVQVNSRTGHNWQVRLLAKAQGQPRQDEEVSLMDRAFLILLVAVAIEVVGTSALKLTDGFTKPIPVAVVVVAYTTTFALMAVAMKSIPINVVYAVWSGLGTASIAVVGWLFFREALTGWSLLGIAMIIGGVAVLHTLGTPHGTHVPAAPPAPTKSATAERS